MIDQRDYNIWRWTDGTTVPPYADANGDGIVNGADYVLWRKAVAVNATRASTGLSFALVPEPSAVALAFGAIYISFMDVRRFLPWS